MWLCFSWLCIYSCFEATESVICCMFPTQILYVYIFRTVKCNIACFCVISKDKHAVCACNVWVFCFAILSMSCKCLYVGLLHCVCKSRRYTPESKKKNENESVSEREMKTYFQNIYYKWWFWKLFDYCLPYFVICHFTAYYLTHTKPQRFYSIT